MPVESAVERTHHSITVNDGTDTVAKDITIRVTDTPLDQAIFPGQVLSSLTVASGASVPLTLGDHTSTRGSAIIIAPVVWRIRRSRMVCPAAGHVSPTERSVDLLDECDVRCSRHVEVSCWQR